MTAEQLIKLLQELPPKKEVRIGTVTHRTRGKKIAGLWNGSDYAEVYPE